MKVIFYMAIQCTLGILQTLLGCIVFLIYIKNKQKKRSNGVSYFSFFTEKWANFLGEKVTKEKSIKCIYE